MTDAPTVCYFNDIFIKAAHPACKMWQADALLVIGTVPVGSGDAGKGCNATSVRAWPAVKGKLVSSAKTFMYVTSEGL
jgi:hypothetical protein